MERSFKLLEYPAVLELLAGETETALGRQMALGLKPAGGLAKVSERLRETSEARAFLQERPGAGLGRVHDLRPALYRLRRGAVLDGPSLVRIAETLEEARRWRTILASDRGRETLARLARFFIVPEGLVEAIRRAVNQDGELNDEASPLLGRLRRDRAFLEERIRSTLEEMLNSGELRQYLQEGLVTQRNERWVLPVKRQYRARVPGILHDTSQSGATLFIEPVAVVNLGNRLREVRSREREESERILRELSTLAARFVGEIRSSHAALGRLDLLFAKARLSAAWDGMSVPLNAEGRLVLRGARHPLLGSRAVPLDLELGGRRLGLVVSGPNTGGKTVALKTVGLIPLLAMAGLQPPVAEGTEIPVFRRILVDLGDEQNLPENLSTFSARIRHWREILTEADADTLVLIDEFGTGTAPREGAALAEAILEELARRRTRVLITSHLGELKAFAHRHPDYENASMEFDAEALLPTYRLILGLPGNSYALPVARRLGMPPEILARAEELLGEEEVSLGEILAEAAELRRELAEERRSAAREREAADALALEYRRRLTAWEGERERLLERAREEAREIVRTARLKVEEALYEARQARLVSEREARQKAHEARELLRSASPVETVPAGGTEGPGDLKPGETVWLKRFNREATVLGREDGFVTVQAGPLRLRLATAEVERASPRRRREENWSRLGAEKRLGFRAEVDLRGLSVEEALDRLEKYLDDARLAEAESVRIIHGKGTGVLRQAVREYLSGEKDIAEVRLGGIGEGGDGVTVVRFSRTPGN